MRASLRTRCALDSKRSRQRPWRPALAEAEVLSSARPVTQREQRLAAELLDKRDAAWRRAISTLDSALPAEVERRLNLEG